MKKLIIFEEDELFDILMKFKERLMTSNVVDERVFSCRFDFNVEEFFKIKL